MFIIFVLQDIYKYYVLDIPARVQTRRISSIQYALLDSELIIQADTYVVLKKVYFLF